MLGKLYSPLMWKTLRAVRFIVATSPAYAATSPVLSHPEIRHKVRVIPNGIDLATYPKEKDEGVLDRLSLNDGEPYFLFIGVLRYYKGLHTLIEAARHVGARIVIAGSGPEEKNLKHQVALSGVNNVRLAGQVTDAEKNTLLEKCRALVLPSHLRSEAFGMVLVEASIFGRPIISCEIGTGTSFVNAHEETGFVIPSEHPAKMAEVMNRLLRDPVMAEKLGQGARARYERLFSGRALGEAYASLYREALAHSV
jgi:rhamnosyl/mannosyltransferase